MDNIHFNEIIIGKDKVHLTTTDGDTFTGILLTTRLPHGYFRFQPDDGDMFEMPLDQISKVEAIKLH